jgi:hypothetical protein
VGQDITSVISDWPFNPEERQVRLVAGDDGIEKIQMRVDLGVLQMETSGRPDGARPHGFESLLEYQESRRDHEESTGSEFTLTHEDCSDLMREGLQYYHRYLSAFHLQRHDLVVRDTERNLRLFAFVVRHASRQRDKIEFDQYRPYVTLMRTRSLTLQALERKDFNEAIVQVDEGIKRVKQFLRDYQQEENEQECAELDFLIRWRREIEDDRPADPVDRLKRQLRRAISLEEFEEAARLRDQIARLEGLPIQEQRPT